MGGLHLTGLVRPGYLGNPWLQRGAAEAFNNLKLWSFDLGYFSHCLRPGKSNYNEAHMTIKKKGDCSM